MREFITILGFCMALGSGGCSDPAPAEPDAAGPDADPGSPSIVATNVEDGAIRVSVLTSLDAVSSHALDPASVDGESVSVESEYGGAVQGDISYDASTRTVSFHPFRAFDRGRIYRWQLTGLRAADGQSLPDIEVRFTTHFNHMLRSIGYGEDGEIRSYDASYHEGDRLSRQVFYNDPGADGEWFTDDDEISGLVRYVSDEHDRNAEAITCNGPGGDGMWMTEDDEVSRYTKYSRDDHGRVTHVVFYAGPGLDEVWFTDDDEVWFAGGIFYRPDGQIDRQVVYSPGPDGIWFTDDDVYGNYSRYEYDELDREVRVVTVSEPGPDGEWLTDDDPVSNYWQSVYGDDRLVAREVYYTQPGPDGQWFTADDVPLNYYVYSYDEHGNLIERKRYSVGPDGELMTDDDVLDRRFEHDTSR